MYLLPEEHKFIDVYCAYCGNTHTVIKQCGRRFCPACAHITRWRVRERMHQLFKLMRHEKNYMLKMLTLSGPNCKNLEDGLNDLITGFRRMRQTKFWTRHVRGGLFCIEVTGEPGNWHPHIHAIVYSLRIPWQGLLDKWAKANPGARSVWIENVSNDGAIYYVTKYVTKPGSDPEYAFTIDEALKGRRLFQRFGSFQKIKLPKYYTARKCEKCGSSDWLTEWDFRKLALKCPG